MKIVILAGRGISTLFIYNSLKDTFSIDKVIIEDTVSSLSLIKRRIRKLGIIKVINQLLFQLTISKLLRFLSKRRIKALKKQYRLSSELIPKDKLLHVSSINSFECIAALKEINPDVVIVNGTRIISTKVLESAQDLFINTHVGITPQYRGVHGAYWALVSDDKENCGVTIHKVDKGIDTGDIIKQANILINNQDNFITYPIHQYGVAIELMKVTLRNIISGNLITYKKEKTLSNLYYHPTFTGYIYNRIYKGVK